MAWTYSTDMTDPLNQVRFLIQDTTSTRQLFSDEEISWVIDTEANVYQAAASLCGTLVARGGSGGGAGVKSEKVGDLAITYDINFYRSLQGQLSARGLGHQVPYAGGISIVDKNAQAQDADWVKPTVVRGLDDNPAAPKPTQPTTDPLTTL